MFSLPEFPEKEKVLPKLDRSRDVTGRVYIICFFYLEVQTEKKSFRVFKNSLGGYVFVFVECLCNRSPKMRIKHFKNYTSILASVNYRNWLNASPLKLEKLLFSHKFPNPILRQCFENISVYVMSFSHVMSIIE